MQTYMQIGKFVNIDFTWYDFSSQNNFDITSSQCLACNIVSPISLPRPPCNPQHRRTSLIEHDSSSLNVSIVKCICILLDDQKCRPGSIMGFPRRTFGRRSCLHTFYFHLRPQSSTNCSTNGKLRSMIMLPISSICASVWLQSSAH